MNRKKTLALTLALAMCISLMACGISQATDTPTELMTIKVMGSDGTYTLDGEQRYFSEYISMGNPVWEQLVANLAAKGVKLELDLIPSDQYDTLLPTQIAAGFKADMLKIIPLDSMTRMELAKQGVFMPINDILEYSDGTASAFYDTGAGQITMKMQSLEDGKLYWFSNVSASTFEGHFSGGPQALLIRNDWLEELGLPLPSTTEELRETLRAFQQNDVNGDGENDEVMSLGAGNESGVAPMFGLGFGNITWPDQDGKVTTLWYHPNGKAYIEYLASLYAEGLYEPNLDGEFGVKMAENKISAFPSYNIDFWSMGSAVVPEGETKPDYIGFRAQAVEGTTPLQGMSGSPLSDYNSFAFTSSVDPKAAAALLDVVCTEDYYYLTHYGVEGVTFERLDDGTLSKITTGSLDAQIMANRNAVWEYNILPVMQLIMDRTEEVTKFMNAGSISKAQADSCIEALRYEHSTIGDPNAVVYAIATADEMDRSQAIKTDLTTYVDELIVNLVLGNESFDNWDEYLSNIKRLGMDELIAIDQARYDRAQR